MERWRRLTVLGPYSLELSHVKVLSFFKEVAAVAEVAAAGKGH